MKYEDKMELTRIIAELVKQRGGTAYYVGGFVRDKILGVESKDIDIEVHSVAPSDLRELLSEVGEVGTYGESFGIHTLKGSDIDIALPRKERLTCGSNSHRNFDVSVDPELGTKEASRRRDFTVNALMEDVLSGEIVDHWGGLSDIRNRILRHVDDNSFPEDPLRVLRGAQFAARFEFTIDDGTLALCRDIDLSDLSRERVEGELRKAMLNAGKPSVFFENLRKMNQLDAWFPELKSLIDLPQDPVFHPEGDVWTHTMEAVDRAAMLRDDAERPYEFMLLALTHDLGKAVTTDFINGRWHAYGHEEAGVPIAEGFLKRLTSDKTVLKYVLGMIPHHMRPNVIAGAKSSVKSSNRMFFEAPSALDLMLFAQVDKPVVAGSEPFTGDPEFLKERYELFLEMMEKPYVTGKDLIIAGYEPDDNFAKALAYATKLRLAGIGKDEAMKQVHGYLRQLKAKCK